MTHNDHQQREALFKLKEQLVALLKQSPEAEAELIITSLYRRTFSTLKNFAELLSNPQIALSPLPEKEALRIAKERATGKPLQYLLGSQFFHSHEYLVNEAVLVPRPETEILVEAVCSWLKDRIRAKEIPENFKFAELGLGSGIISIEILSAFPQSTGVATEISQPSIAVARENLKKIIGEKWETRLKIIEPENSQIGFEKFIPFGPFSLIVSNPPYVSVQDEIQNEVLQHEPHQALFPTLDGEVEQPNFFYENFLLHSFAIFGPHGAAFFEIPHERSEVLLKRFKLHSFSDVKLIEDLTGRDRVLFAQSEK